MNRAWTVMEMGPPHRMVVLLGVLALVAACGSANNPVSERGPTDPSGTIGNSYDLTQIGDRSQSLVHAIGLSVIPGNDDEAVVWSQDGIIWQVSLVESGSATAIGDISDRTKEFGPEPVVEYGLLGLVFSPEFQLDGQVYLYYTAKDLPSRTVLSRFTVVPGGFIDESSEQILLEVPQPSDQHNGGQLAFGPDNYLYLALGDGGPPGEQNPHGQDRSTLLATILRLDVSGAALSIPPDNPFVDDATARSEIYAYGLRNPWRFSFDRLTGDLWAGDVGGIEWEEINLIVAGGNYGWRVVEGSECIGTSSCDTSSFRPPHFAYPHGEGCAAIIGGYVYRGDSMPELNGWYVYGDFCNMDGIWAVNTTGEPAAMRLTAFDELPTAFAERSDGELLVLTYDGRIFQLGRGADLPP